MYFVNQYISGAVFITVVLFCYICSLAYHVSLRITLVTGIISFGLSYIASFVAAIFLTPISYALFMILSEESVGAFYYILTGILQQFVVMIPFQFGRFKNGMPYLQMEGAGDLGIVFSILLLFAASLLSTHPGNDIRVPIYLVAASEAGFALIMWWRNKIMFRFFDKTRKKQIRDLEIEKQQTMQELEALKQDNERLSRILHTNTKILSSVKDIVAEYSQAFDYPEEIWDQEVEGLRKRLDALLDEHSDVVHVYRHFDKHFPETGVMGVDSMISYMGQMAYEAGINFDFNFTGNIKYLAETEISQIDLASLLSDLIENAIIAERDTEEKNIFVYISILDSHYVIDVSDSGIPFEADTIAKLGKERVTTHASTGGHGFGMEIIFEILRKVNASLVVDDSVQGGPFTKKVSVYFDGLSQFRIKTERQEIRAIREIRPDIIWE